jgi:hypothetical protein
MRSWNVIVTVATGLGHQSRLLGQLRRLGYFDRTEFKNVCIGHVENTPNSSIPWKRLAETASRSFPIWGASSRLSKPFPSLPKP